MENSGEIIIYIFLAIFFIVKAVFDSSKKKRQQKQILGPQGREVEIPEEDELEEERQDKSFWEILEEMQKPHKEPKPQSVPASPPVVKQKMPEKRQPFTRKTTASSYTAKTTSRSQVKNTSAVKHEDAYTAINEETFHDKDELRKAIIYSEILNRKY